MIVSSWFTRASSWTRTRSTKGMRGEMGREVGKNALLVNTGRVASRSAVISATSTESRSSLHRRTCFIPLMLAINHGVFNKLHRAAPNNTHIPGKFIRAYCRPLHRLCVFFYYTSTCPTRSFSAFNYCLSRLRAQHPFLHISSRVFAFPSRVLLPRPVYAEPIIWQARNGSNQHSAQRFAVILGSADWLFSG